MPKESDDDYEGDVDFDSFVLGQEDLDALDALEAEATKPNKTNKSEADRHTTTTTTTTQHSRNIIKPDPNDDDLLLDDTEDWEDADLLNEVMEVERRYAKGEKRSDVHQSRLPPFKLLQDQAMAGPSSRRSNGRHVSGSGSSASQGSQLPLSGGRERQMNLFGEVVPMQASQGMLLVAKKAHSATATASQKVRDALKNNKNHRFHMEKPRKEWDRSQPITVKNKSTDCYDDEAENWDDDGADDINSFNIAPPPIAPEGLKKMKVPIDREEAQKWIYPTNKEKRDYQFNIVQRALFNNVLVALPTGLGKTFIAAVVILNYYRWFPTGKIIFVAPTKPLVAQQQQACHGICGLPWSCAVEMTGGTKASLRGDEWKTKRIFYMTPQTFENDLCSTAVDAEDVVCVVVDEAHRATGNYAYGKVIKWITQRNPFFRVLALTATPGNKPEKVQEVIDNLHINLIEIRTEEAVDIRKYVHTKTEDPVVVPLGGVVKEIKDLFSKMMRPLLEILNKNGLITIKEPCSLPSFALTAMNKDPYKRSIIAQRKLYVAVKDLGDMARAMEYLIRHSVEMFMERLTSLQSGVNNTGKKASTNRQRQKFTENTIIREIEAIYQGAQNKKGKVMHPKMEYLQNVVASHFSSEEEQGRREDTRVMVFCLYRECVLEIVDMLNENNEIKATAFVGQSSDTRGNKGMRQNEQEKIVQDFKNGKYNVLVATSIGEEGLDIGEVDLIVNYEAVKNSIRMLQRIGRTGRKRKGRIVVLMSEGSEENNWQHSKDNHRTIQDELINGSHLELFDDVERLVPEDITSVAVSQEVDQPLFEPSMIRAPTRIKKVAKPKRNSDPNRNIPKNGLKGFVKVSEMKKKKKGGRASMREGDSSELQTSDSGNNATSSAEDEMTAASSSKVAALTDDSDDEHLQHGFVISTTTKEKKVANAMVPPSESLTVPFQRRKTGRLGTGRAAIPPSHRSSAGSRGSASSQVEINLLSSSPVIQLDQSSPLQTSRINVQPNVQTLSDDDDDEFSTTRKTKQVVSPSSSPIKPLRRSRPHPLVAQLAAELEDSDEENEEEQEENKEQEQEEEEEPVQKKQPKRTKESKKLNTHQPKDDEASSPEPLATTKRKRTTFSRRKTATIIPSSSPLPTMGPPSVPPKRVEKKGKERERKEDKDTMVGISTSPKKKKKRLINGSPTSRRLFQYEADRSTDEEVHGEKDEDDDGQDTDEADSSDLEHVGDFAPTQAPRGYKQDAIYLQSLHSQANLTPFRQKARGTMAGYQMGIDSEQVRRYVQDTPRRSDDPDRDQDEDYEKDSFVCSDEDVVFDSESQSSQL